jgi:hypothetical protein
VKTDTDTNARIQTTSTTQIAKSLDACSHSNALSIWWPLSWRSKLIKLNQPNQLSPEDLHLFLDADFDSGVLTWKKRSREFFKSNRSASVWNVRFAGKPALCSNHVDGYKHGSIFGNLYLAHRVILAMKLGYWPEYVDHINGNRLDNRIANLRPATKVQNGCNRATPSNNTSGHIGVCWNKRDKRWTAYITLNQKRKALGNFKEIKDAIQCRKAGEFAYGFHPNHGRVA